jgi:hypothetical protein
MLLLLAMPASVPAQAQGEGERCPAQLPTAVAVKRAAILAAAQKKDLVALKNLASTVDFTFSYGGETDPVEFWKKTPPGGIDAPRALTAVLTMSCVMGEGGSFVWPSAAMIDWGKLRPDEQNALVALYGKKIDQYWLEGRNKGYYVGWRVSIEPDGSWSSFVIGD